MRNIFGISFGRGGKREREIVVKISGSDSWVEYRYRVIWGLELT